MAVSEKNVNWFSNKGANNINTNIKKHIKHGRHRARNNADPVSI